MELHGEPMEFLLRRQADGEPLSQGEYERSERAFVETHDLVAYGVIVRANQTLLERIAMRRLDGDEDVAEEVVQDAFLKLWTGRPTPEKPRAWLITVVINATRREGRRQARFVQPKRHRDIGVSDADFGHGGCIPHVVGELERMERYEPSGDDTGIVLPFEIQPLFHKIDAIVGVEPRRFLVYCWSHTSDNGTQIDWDFIAADLRELKNTVKTRYYRLMKTLRDAFRSPDDDTRA